MHVELTNEHLSVERAIALVKSPGAGAISTFIGTTRDHFQGKPVLKLEYEAYHDLAMKYLHQLAKEAYEKYNQIHGIAIYHRLGEVPVEEASVVIAVSAAHRKPALDAVEYLIDELKVRCPIWKKEVYGDGNSTWKQNCPGCHASNHHKHQV